MLITFAAFVLLLTAVSLSAVFAPAQRPAFDGFAAMADDSSDDDDEEFESFAWELGDLRPTEE